MVNKANNLAIDNKNDLDIYIEDIIEEEDKLTRYLGERRAPREVSTFIILYYIIIYTNYLID